MDKLLVLLAVGLVVLGPERLPKVAADAGRLLRTLRRLAQEATGELKDELAPHLKELDLADLEVPRLAPLLDRYLSQTFSADAPVAPAQAEAATPGPAFDPEAT